jgi:two-component system, cell cycle sensor histidine kinase and response regulator CckA
MTPSPTTRSLTTVLLVDDEEMLRRLLTRALSGAGFMVFEAANGEEALAHARSLNGQLSIVVTDIRMPVMDGIEFARAFRPQFPKVPILFMTGKEPVDSDGMTAGVGESLLRKPFSPDQLLEAVVRTLEQGMGRSTA